MVSKVIRKEGNLEVRKMPKQYIGVKILSKAPKGWMKVNAATAPLGLDVYRNKVSLFDPTKIKKRVLVKNKWHNKFVKYI